MSKGQPLGYELPECESCAALRQQLADMKGPGTPYARWHWIMEELEKRFPDSHPYDSSRPSESYYFEAIDRVGQQLATVTAERDQERRRSRDTGT